MIECTRPSSPLSFCLSPSSYTQCSHNSASLTQSTVERNPTTTVFPPLRFVCGGLSTVRVGEIARLGFFEFLKSDESCSSSLTVRLVHTHRTTEPSPFAPHLLDGACDWMQSRQSAGAVAGTNLSAKGKSKRAVRHTSDTTLTHAFFVALTNQHYHNHHTFFRPGPP
jgi:hypothetical protein